MPKGYLLQEITWNKARNLFKDIKSVVIPIGSIEQHGFHLPLGTDFLAAQEIARRLCQHCETIVLPTLPFGYAQNHRGFEGTITLTDNTLSQTLIEICQNLLSYGSTHFLFINGHGGNMRALEKCGDWLRDQNALSAIACWWQMTEIIHPDLMAIGHADYIETAAIQAIDEKLIDQNYIDQEPEHKQFASNISFDNISTARFKGTTLSVNLRTSDISQNGTLLSSNPEHSKLSVKPHAAGTKEIGDEILDGLAKYLADFLQEFVSIKIGA